MLPLIRAGGPHPHPNPNPRSPILVGPLPNDVQTDADAVVDYYDTLGERKVLSDVAPGYLRPLLPDGPPEHGEPWTAIQQDLTEKILPGLTHWWASPSFSSIIPAVATCPQLVPGS